MSGNGVGQSTIIEFATDAKKTMAAGTAGSLTWWASRFVAWQEASDCPIDDPTVVRRFVESLVENGQKPRSARLGTWAVRRYLRWLAEVKGITIPDQVLPRIPSTHFEVMWTPSAAEVDRVVAEADTMPRPYGDALRVIAATGMRDGEACNLGMSDWRVVRGAVVFIVRRGKNNRGREVPLRPEAATNFRTYLIDRRPEALAGRSSPWIFPRARSPQTPISRHRMEDNIRLLRDRLGLPDLTAHGLRRAFVTWCKRRPPRGPGMSDQETMRLIGHANSATFARYYSPDADDLVDLVAPEGATQ